jgi:Type II secretion system (T2SS), protein G
MLRTRLWFGCLLVALLAPVQAYADLSQSNARKLIQTMGGWSLPGSAVRIQSFRSNGAEGAEVSAEIQAVFRLRLREGLWELREIRTGPDRWERLDVIARAAGVELPRAECDAPAQFTNIKSPSELTNKRARCLVAELLGIQLPSDDVRIREISSFGLSLGAESSALVTALVQVDFRFAREARRWSVVELRSGNRDWVNVTGLPAAMDQVKRTEAANELLTVAKALGDFHRDRGYFVVSKSESVLIDHLSPKYLARVIRIDPWHRPYHYEGQQDRYSLRSAGPDGIANTEDDIVVSGP